MAHTHYFLILLFILQCTSSLQEQISNVDMQALRELKTVLRCPNFFSTWNFASPDPCSSFSGLTCSLSKRVDSIQLGTGLSGSLEFPSLSSLSELTQFVLSPGSITGQIPSQFGSLSNLRVLVLAKNQLTGPIPESIFSLPNIHTLDFSFNLLSGSVPPGLSSMNRLKILVLASNQLYGPIPKTFPPQLMHVDLKNNRFLGQLPNRMPLSIRYLSLSSNELVGPIDGLVSLSELVYLDLSMNQFSGSIPGPLFRPGLSSVLLQHNNFSGTLPVEFPSPSFFSSLSLYGPGSIVDLSHNAINGELSRVLVDVETVFLNNNRLTGSVPIEYVNSVSSGRTRTLFLQHNFFSSVPVEKSGTEWPESATMCVSYNCMVPPVQMTACPASAGGQLARPITQCLIFNNSSHIIGD